MIDILGICRSLQNNLLTSLQADTLESLPSLRYYHATFSL
jgi:hypothetical protein